MFNSIKIVHVHDYDYVFPFSDYKIVQTILHGNRIVNFHYKHHADTVSHNKIVEDYQFHNDFHENLLDNGIYYFQYIYRHSYMESHIVLLKKVQSINFVTKKERNGQNNKLILLTKFTMGTIISFCTLARIFLNTFTTIHAFFLTNT